MPCKYSTDEHASEERSRRNRAKAAAFRSADETGSWARQSSWSVRPCSGYCVVLEDLNPAQPGRQTLSSSPASTLSPAEKNLATDAKPCGRQNAPPGEEGRSRRVKLASGASVRSQNRSAMTRRQATKSQKTDIKNALRKSGRDISTKGQLAE